MSTAEPKLSELVITTDFKNRSSPRPTNLSLCFSALVLRATIGDPGKRLHMEGLRAVVRRDDSSVGLREGNVG